MKSGRLETDTKSERKLSAMKAEELAAEVSRLRERYMTLKSQSVSEKVHDNSQFGKIKRDIARLLGEQTRRARA